MDKALPLGGYLQHEVLCFGDITVSLGLVVDAAVCEVLFFSDTTVPLGLVVDAAVDVDIFSTRCSASATLQSHQD